MICKNFKKVALLLGLMSFIGGIVPETQAAPIKVIRSKSSPIAKKKKKSWRPVKVSIKSHRKLVTKALTTQTGETVASASSSNISFIEYGDNAINWFSSLEAYDLQVSLQQFQPVFVNAGLGTATEAASAFEILDMGGNGKLDFDEIAGFFRAVDTATGLSTNENGLFERDEVDLAYAHLLSAGQDDESDAFISALSEDVARFSYAAQAGSWLGTWGGADGSASFLSFARAYQGAQLGSYAKGLTVAKSFDLDPKDRKLDFIEITCVMAAADSQKGGGNSDGVVRAEEAREFYRKSNAELTTLVNEKCQQLSSWF